MAKTNEKKKRLHLSRIPAYGTSVLTKCGRRKNLGTFVNPNAKLCEQCVALAAEEGLTVEMTWKPVTAYGNEEPKGRWIVSASPPMIERQGDRLIDRNNPDAPPVYLDVNKVLALSGMSYDDYYDVHGPHRAELTTG